MTETFAAQIIWDYMNIRQEPERSDLIMVLCSNDIRVAEYAADLYLQKYAPKILFSGGVAHTNDILATSWNIPEAEKFAEIAIEKGVLMKDIIIENKATNTGENIRFSFEILKASNFELKKIILVQKPFMLRRTHATFMKQWPSYPLPDFVLCSAPLSFDNYPDDSVDREQLIHTMVGDLQRIKLYPEKGYQIYQEIPPIVWQAYETLMVYGYTKHLIGN